MRAQVGLAWAATPLSLGELTTIDRRTYFEASPYWLEHPIQVDPAGAPQPGPVEVPRGDIHNPILGMLGDSIPDGWGLKVLHLRARRLGFTPEEFRPEQLLCLVGHGGSGALVYDPATDPGDNLDPVHLEALYRESMELIRGEPAEVLRGLSRAVGGSGGVRPKVSIDQFPDGSVVGHGGPRPAGCRTFLVKFPTVEDGSDYGSVELAYAEMARAAGVMMPETRAFDLDGDSVRCFGVERFDRPQAGWRPHVLSLAAVLRANFRRDLTTYETYLNVTFALAPALDQVLEAYRRMVFNVLAAVRDDHMKNFAFLLPPHGEWGLAPAFDLVPTLAREHATTVGGLASEITRAALRRAIAEVTALPVATLLQIEEQVQDSVAQWSDLAQTWGVDPRRVRQVQQELDAIWRAF